MERLARGERVINRGGSRPAPAISVVMCCYNEEKAVGRAIESISSQSYTDFEFIIVNDASQDGTRGIIARYAAADARIRVIDNPCNIGVAASLNAGIDASRAPLIARMDADDVSYPERFARQLAFMDSHPDVDILGTAVDLVNKQTGEDLGRFSFPAEHEDIVAARYRSTLVAHPTVMIRKRVFTEVGRYDPRVTRAQDTDLWLRILDEVRFHNLSDVTLRYAVKTRITWPIYWRGARVTITNMRRRKELLQYYPTLAVGFTQYLRSLLAFKSRTLRGKHRAEN